MKDKGKAKIAEKAKALEKLQIEYLPVTAIQPNDYNPNRQSDHDFELLKRSMAEDGFTQPVIVLEAPNPDGRYTVVDGEHRWRAARDLGLGSIPVVKVPMTAEQARIATLRHNRARGSEDLELAAQVLRDLEKVGAIGWAQESLMLSDVEIEKLLADVPAPEALAGEEFSEGWTPASSQPGDGEVREESGMAVATTSSTEASDRLRERERRIAAARTEEERTRAVTETAVFRLAQVFTAEQGRIVRAAIGNSGQAERLLRLCCRLVAAGELASDCPPEVAAEIGQVAAAWLAEHPAAS